MKTRVLGDHVSPAVCQAERLKTTAQSVDDSKGKAMFLEVFVYTLSEGMFYRRRTRFRV